jgi:hypothetical protein
MKEPLTVKIEVTVLDADNKVKYNAPHSWPGMSEAYEVEFLAALHDAVANLGRAKLAGKAKS